MLQQCSAPLQFPNLVKLSKHEEEPAQSQVVLSRKVYSVHADCMMQCICQLAGLGGHLHIRLEGQFSQSQNPLICS